MRGQPLSQDRDIGCRIIVHRGVCGMRYLSKRCYWHGMSEARDCARDRFGVLARDEQGPTAVETLQEGRTVIIL